MANGIDEQIAERQAELERLRFESMSPIGAIGNSVGQGLSFGWSDEGAAGVAAVLTNPFSDQTFQDLYDEQLEIERGNLETARRKYPKLSLAAELGGGIYTGGNLYSLTTKSLSNLPALVRLMSVGGVEGAAYGAGTGEEGNRLRGTAIGTGIGIAGGPLGAVAGHVFGNLARNTVGPLWRRLFQTPRARANQKVLDTLEADDITTYQAQLEMADLGEQAVVADISQGLTDLGRSMAGYQGRGRGIAERLVHGRQRNQQHRLLAGAGVDADELDDFTRGIARMLQNRNTQATPYYERAYETVVRQTDSMADALSVIPRSILSKARTLYRGDLDVLNEIAKKFPDTPEGRAAILRLNSGPISGREAARRTLQTPEGIDENSVMFYDYVKRSLDDRIGSSLRAGRRQEARNFIRMKEALLGELDEQVPDYRRAREIFTDEESMKSAVDYGRSLFSNSVDLAETELALEAMSMGERNAFRNGAIRGLVDRVERAPEMRNFASYLVESKRMRRLLSLAFPNEEVFDSFIKTAIAENRMAATRAGVTAGARTAPMTEGMKDLAAQAPMVRSLQQNDATGVGLSFLRSLGHQGVDQEYLVAVANILFNRALPKSTTERSMRWYRQLVGTGPGGPVGGGATVGVMAGEKVLGED